MAAAEGAGEQPLWFGLIGRFQSIKGQPVFLEAAARVAAACPAAHFLLAGAGNATRRRHCREMAQALGIADRTLITGYLDNLPEVLASLDVGVIASLGSEGSSRIALEMMAAGLPLVATRVGDLPDIAEGGAAARLVAPGERPNPWPRRCWPGPVIRKPDGRRADAISGVFWTPITPSAGPRRSIVDVYRALLAGHKSHLKSMNPKG